MNSARFQKRNSLVKRILTGSRVQSKLLTESEKSEKGVQRVTPPKTFSPTQLKEFEAIKSRLSKRNLKLSAFYQKLGVTKEQMWKRTAKLKSGQTAEGLFYKLTKWKIANSKVEMIPTPTALVFLIEEKVFMQITKKEFSVPGKYAYFDPAFPGVIVINKRLWREPMFDKKSGTKLYGRSVLEHELEHLRQDNLQIGAAILPNNAKGRRKQIAALHKTSLTLSSKISAEIAANLRDKNFAKYSRTRFKNDSKDIANLSLDAKNAQAFMRNEGNFLKSVYRDTRKAIDLVEKARRSYAVLPNGQRVRALSNEELVNIVNNIGNVKRLVQRLPRIVEEAKRQKLLKRN